MRLVYDKWRIPITDSFQESEERGGLLFRHAGMVVWVHQRSNPSKAEGVRLVKAEANPRHVTLFEIDRDGVYHWAFQHVEELEAGSLERQAFEARCVIEGETLTVVAEHQSPDQARWADGVVRGVQFVHDWRIERSVTVTVLKDRYVISSHSRGVDGWWALNGFDRSLPADAAAPALGKLVRQALGRCRRLKSRKLAADDAAFLKLAGLASRNDYNSLARVVYVQVEDGVVKVSPTWAGRGYGQVDAWFLPAVGEVRLPLDCSTPELGQSVLTAKANCVE